MGIHKRAWGGHLTRLLALLAAFLLSASWTGQAAAQLPPPGTPSQFDMTGFLQEATLNGPNPTATTGGRLKVNNHVVIVPDNTIVILPANALTWQELFSQAPPPYTNVATGLAMNDSPAPPTTYEAHVIGNRVGDTYIAGLIYLSQQDLNSGAGYVNYIDYATSTLYVGGTLSLDPAGKPQNVLDANNPGARVRINDPSGRFAPALSPDVRFTLDPDNPTVRAETGYPMCVPRPPQNYGTPSVPPNDPLCPQLNRPIDTTGNFVTSFTMPDPKALAPGQLPDPRIMAPFEVGDYVTYAGNLVPDGTGGAYIAAHTMVANVGIYTAPGTNPAYVAIDVTILGTGGLSVLGAGEAAVRTRFEGMTTDPSRNIHLYGIDVDAAGNTSDRDWGTVGVDPGAPAGAVQGRWRFRPPCTATTPTQKACTPPSGGVFLPVTREVRAVVEGAWTPSTTQAATGGANGLMAGQYHAPILEYIFPENVPGTPPPPNNFDTIPFLAQGGYTSSLGTLAGQLHPWPGKQAPATCSAPAVSAGADFSVGSGVKAVPLAGTASGSGPFTYAWTQTGGTKVAVNNANAATANFDAPSVSTGQPAQVLAFQLAVTGCNNQVGTATVNVTVQPAQAAAAPIITPIPPRTVQSGVPVTLTATSSGSSATTYTWTQAAGPAQPFTQNKESISFTHILPINQITSDVLSYQVTATDGGKVSAPVTATLTVTPLPDSIAITTAEYRTGKQRLDLTVTSSIVNPNLVLTLQPYVTTTGTTFDPTALGATLTNTGGGTYTLTLVGAPQPGSGAVLLVKSGIGGQSLKTALTRIRN